MKKAITRYLTHYIVVFPLWLLSIPIAFMPYRARYALSYIIGGALYALNTKPNKITRRNLLLSFPDKDKAERERMVKQVQIYAIYSLFNMTMALMRPKHLRSLVDITGQEHLERYASNGLLFGVHASSVYTTAQAIASCEQAKKFPVAFMISIPSVAILAKLFYNTLTCKIDADYQQRLVYNNRGVLLQATRDFVKNKGLFLLAADQDLGARNSVMVPFFAMQEVATSCKTLKLASIAKANIFFCTGYWLKGRYQLHFDPPLKNFPTDDEKQNAALLNKKFESMIMQAPEQYLWFHKRFKTRPEGVASRYEDLK